MGAANVLVKGGHHAGEKAEDVLFAEGQAQVFSAPRIETQNTHGTGCTTASAVAAGLAQGPQRVAEEAYLDALQTHRKVHAGTEQRECCAGLQE